MMLLFRSLFCILPLCGIVIASTQTQNLSLSDMPTCALQCTAKLLPQANCGTKDFVQCFCDLSNNTLRLDISACTATNCNIINETLAADISRKVICSGYPIASRKGEVITTTAVIAAVAITFVALRMLSRILIAGKLRWDDYLILFTALIMIANTAIQITSCEHGFGKHFYDIEPDEASLLIKLFYSTQIIYVFNQNVPKLSILILYLQIFTNPSFVRIVKLSMLWVAAHTISFLFAVAFQCFPVSRLWDTSVQGRCVNKAALLYAGAGFSIAEDIVIMLLPIIELRHLNLRWRKRVDLMLMFAIGSFACLTSIIRLKFVKQYGKTNDVPWDNVSVVIWSEIETYTAVTCACLIPIRPLILKWIPARIFGSTFNTTSHLNTPSFVNKRSQSRWKYPDTEGDQDPLHRSQKSESNIIVNTDADVSYELDRRDPGSSTDGRVSR